MDLTTATPAAIDTEYVEVHAAKVAPFEAKLDQMVRNLQWALAYDFRGRQHGTEQQIADHRHEVKLAREALADARTVLAPYDAEFERRGGWTRAFLVKANGGHIHSSMDCSTCNRMGQATQFFWLPEVSGHDEAEIVSAAGEGACTVCYPTAPCTGPRTLLHETERQAQRDREQRAAEKAERAAKKLAKALLADGSDLRLPDSRDRISTLAAGKAFLTDSAMWNSAAYTSGHEAGWRHPSFTVADTLLVAEAVAAKLGTTAEVEIAAAVKRADKRR